MSMPLFHGSIVALVTPMTHGEVNYTELKNLVEKNKIKEDSRLPF